MMTYEQLIETFSAIIENDKINKDGLILFYELDDENHEKMDEHLFYKGKDETDKDIKFEHRDIIEVDVEGFTIHIIKKGWKLSHENLEE